MDGLSIVDNIINELKTTNFLDNTCEENDWQSLMQYFITSEFLNTSFDTGWFYLDMIIENNLDKLTSNEQVSLTIESFEMDRDAREIGERQGIINDDSDYDEIETICEEANFGYIKKLLREQADYESSEYQEALENAIYVQNIPREENELFAKKEVCNFLKETIKNEKEFNEGHLSSFKIKKIENESNYLVLTIEFDEDGLKLESFERSCKEGGSDKSIYCTTHPIEEEWQQEYFYANLEDFIKDLKEALRSIPSELIEIS